MIRLLALALVFTSGCALAQTAPAAEFVPPKADGEHACAMVDPGLLERSGGELFAILAYQISKEGVPQDVAVTRSTGSTALDRSFIDCVIAWRYKPATRNGEAVAAPWVVALTRRLVKEKIGGWVIELPPDPVTHKTLPVVRPELGPRHACFAADVRGGGIAAGPAGVTQVSFVITRAGTVKDIVIEQTNPHYNLADKSIQCVSQWHYLPATENGFPIDFPWKADIEWVLH